MLDHTVTYPGVREGLAALEGMAMAVLTNKPVRFSQRIIEGLGLAKYFRFIYGGNSFETKKPDPEGMRSAFARFPGGSETGHARGRFRSGRANGPECRYMGVRRHVRIGQQASGGLPTGPAGGQPHRTGRISGPRAGCFPSAGPLKSAGDAPAEMAGADRLI